MKPAQPTSSNTKGLKISRSEFKAVVKESLRELISEGAFNNMFSSLVMESQQQMGMMPPQMQAAVDPRIQAAAIAAARGNPKQASVMNEIFMDTMMRTIPERDAQENHIAEGVSLNQFPMFQQSLQQQQIPTQQPFGFPQQQVPMPQAFQPQQQVVPRNLLPPRDPNFQPPQPAGMLNEAAASPWARLAFNKPIVNRPPGGFAPGGGSLPGMNKTNSF